MDIPTTTPTTIEKPARGLAAWAVQRALNSLGATLVEDGAFGFRTEGAVASFQTNSGLSVDGRCGPMTQAKIARKLEAKVPGQLPVGLLKGFTEGESGNRIAAVNWNVAGGTDCGFVQRRVYDGSDDATKKRAFDSLYQLTLLGANLHYWSDRYMAITTRDPEECWRLSALHHNYPSGSEKIAAVGESGLSAYWTTPQDWVKAIGAKFTDGVPVKTPLDWCRFYSLGSVEHNWPGSVTRYVSEWL